jgi:5'-methylthioadenosine phosphorylase
LKKPEARIGVIGGSGLYEIEGLEDLEEVELETPFGKPSDAITLGTLEGKRIAFLPRHGRGHRLSPTEVPARANIYVLKSLGVEWLISVNTVGSLREEIKPLHIVIPHQLIDRTKGRVNSFFDGGIVVHTGFAEPFCLILRRILGEVGEGVGTEVHREGVCVVIEGPLFSTKAESQLYRSLGADIIGMTTLPEAKLAREAEMCYATIACVTDYDCWREKEEVVTTEMVKANLERCMEMAKGMIKRACARLPRRRECGCATALKDAIITAQHCIPQETKERFALLIGKYVQ